MLLKRSFSFWLQAAKSDRQSYDDNLIHITVFNNVDEFWHIYQYMCRPSQLIEGSQFLLFQDGIKPKWEDQANINGGRYLHRLKHGVDKIWEDLILSYIGEQCSLNEMVCGLIIHQKKTFTLISIWVKESNVTQKDKLDQWFMDTLNIQDRNELEYQEHPKLEEHL